MITYFTSITANYLPKARVLARSVKRYDPVSRFVLVLADFLPDGVDIENEPFDRIVFIEDLDIPDLQPWIFKHSVVELCTAVKGPVMLKLLLEQPVGEGVIYLDPDIVVFSSLDDLKEELRMADGLLTPHQVEPESDPQAVIDNEICSLKHGVYNIGFLALNHNPGGLSVAKWWKQRLLDHCFADIPNGLFTDQKWCDLIPCFFPGVRIYRHKGCNVATWNLTHRDVVIKENGMLFVNDVPLVFYHFSGFDSGAQEVMLNRYAKKNSPLIELRAWYIAECNKAGQIELGARPGKFDFFSNGEKVTKAMRLLYRSRADLQNVFKTPYTTSGDIPGFYGWFVHTWPKENGQTGDTSAAYQEQLVALEKKLAKISSSKSFQLARVLRKPWRVINPNA